MSGNQLEMNNEMSKIEIPVHSETKSSDFLLKKVNCDQLILVRETALIQGTHLKVEECSTDLKGEFPSAGASCSNESFDRIKGERGP